MPGASGTVIFYAIAGHSEFGSSFGAKDGAVSYSFAYVDKALDFLISIGLKPMIQLSFMPQALARDNN